MLKESHQKSPLKLGGPTEEQILETEDIDQKKGGVDPRKIDPKPLPYESPQLVNGNLSSQKRNSL